MNMELSHKDKKLLVYLFSILILFAAYYLGAKSFLDKNLKNTDKITNLEDEIRQLSEIYNNRENYSARIAEEQSKIDEAMAKFPPGFAQENTLMMIEDIEKNTGVWISRVAFSEEEILSGEADNMALEDEIDTFVDEKSAEDGTGSENSSVENIVNSAQTLTMDYYCSYSDFKRFLSYVKDYDNRLYISSISATYSVDSNAVSGNLSLRQYAIYGTDKELIQPDLSAIETGTDNIFTNLSGTMEFGTIVASEDTEENLIPASELENQENSEVDGEENQDDSENSNELNELQESDDIEPVEMGDDAGNGRRPRR